MQSRELAFIYFFIRCPYRTRIPRHPFSRVLPHHRIQLSSLYLIQLAGLADRDEVLFVRFCLPICLLFRLHFSVLVSALLIFILTCYTYILIFPLPPFGHLFSF